MCVEKILLRLQALWQKKQSFFTSYFFRNRLTRSALTGCMPTSSIYSRITEPSLCPARSQLTSLAFTFRVRLPWGVLICVAVTAAGSRSRP